MAVIFLTKVATFGFVGDDRSIALDKPGSHCMLSTSGTA